MHKPSTQLVSPWLLYRALRCLLLLHRMESVYNLLPSNSPSSPCASISTKILTLSSTFPSFWEHSYHVDSRGRNIDPHFSRRYVFAIRSKKLSNCHIRRHDSTLSDDVHTELPYHTSPNHSRSPRFYTLSIVLIGPDWDVGYWLDCIS